MERFLPDSFKAKAVGSAKKILELHKNLLNKTELEAKFEYVKMARDLKTFGVHFFLVRVRAKFFLDFCVRSRLGGYNSNYHFKWQILFIDNKPKRLSVYCLTFLIKISI